MRPYRHPPGQRSPELTAPPPQRRCCGRYHCRPPDKCGSDHPRGDGRFPKAARGRVCVGPMYRPRPTPRMQPGCPAGSAALAPTLRVYWCRCPPHTPAISTPRPPPSPRDTPPYAGRSHRHKRPATPDTAVTRRRGHSPARGITPRSASPARPAAPCPHLPPGRADRPNPARQNTDSPPRPDHGWYRPKCHPDQISRFSCPPCNVV